MKDNKSTWNHRILAHQNPDDSVSLMLHEVHYVHGMPVTYNDGAVMIGDRLADLIEQSRMIQEAMFSQNPILWAGDKFPQVYEPVQTRQERLYEFMLHCYHNLYEVYPEGQIAPGYIEQKREAKGFLKAIEYIKDFKS